MPTKTITIFAFLIFSLFVGAGNIFIPPMVGADNQTGTVLAILGFSLTAIGLPLFGLYAIKRSGNYQALMSYLPAWVMIGFITVIYINIGPLFAIPRTATVSFELGLPQLAGTDWRYAYSLIYFVISVLLALKSERLVQYLGRIVSPLLFLCVLTISWLVWFGPNEFQVAHFSKGTADNFWDGLLTGYLTMDGLVSIIFGTMILYAIKQSGEKQVNLVFNRSIITAASMMFVLYATLIVLGAKTAPGLPVGSEGKDALSAFIMNGFGKEGQFLISAIIMLACLTTAVGLLAACGAYFYELTKFRSYSFWLISTAVISALFSLGGLSTLLTVSVPVLYAVYPVLITALLLYIIHSFTSCSVFALRATFYSVTIFSVAQVIITLPYFSSTNIYSIVKGLPWQSQQLTWTLVFAASIIISEFIVNKLFFKRYIARAT